MGEGLDAGGDRVVLVGVPARARGGVLDEGSGGSLREDLRDHVVDDSDDLLLLLKGESVGLGGGLGVAAAGGLERDHPGGDHVREVDLGLLAGVGAEDGGLPPGVHVVGGGHREVAILAGEAVGGHLALHVGELLLEGLGGLEVLDVVDPEEREDIGDVGAGLARVLVGVAGGVDGGGGGDVDVLGDVDLVEHRARVAGLDVEDKLAVEALVVHGLEGGLELGRVDVAAVGEAEDVAAAVVVKEDKEVVVGGGLEGLARADAGHVLAGKDLEEVVGGGLRAGVVVGDSGVHVGGVSSVVVEDLALVGVGAAVGDIVVHEHDDVLVGDAEAVGDLVAVADVGLVTVVAVALGAGSENDPDVGLEGLLVKTAESLGVLVTVGGKRKDSKSKKDLVHLTNTKN